MKSVVDSNAMKLTKKQILDLHSGLLLVGNLTGVKFAYVIAKNTQIIKPELEALTKASEPSPEYYEYEKKRIKLAKSYAVKENGILKTKVENGVPTYVLHDEDKFDVEITKLQKEYEPYIEAVKKQEKELEEILKEEVDLPLLMLSSKDIPEGISATQMSALMPIINDSPNIN